LFIWFFPAFNVETGFSGDGGLGFGVVLAYLAIGGGDWAASWLLKPIFATWKELTLEEKAEAQRLE